MVVAKANELFPRLNFNFMTWIKGSCVPALVCAALLPMILAWFMGLSKSTYEIDQEEGNDEQSKLEGDDIIKYAEQELGEMGSMSLREWVRI